MLTQTVPTLLSLTQVSGRWRPSPQGPQHHLEGWGGSPLVGTARGASLPSALVLTDSPRQDIFFPLLDANPGLSVAPPHTPLQPRGPSCWVRTGVRRGTQLAAGDRGTASRDSQGRGCSYCLSRPSLKEGMSFMCVCMRASKLTVTASALNSHSQGERTGKEEGN